MRKAVVIFCLGFLLLLVNNVWAGVALLRFDLSAIGAPSGTKTDIFTDLSILVETTSYYNDPLDPTAFTDVGDLLVTSLEDPSGQVDDKGLGTYWEITGHWEDLTGNIVNQTTGTDSNWGPFTEYQFNYISGTMDLYAHLLANPSYQKGDFGSDIGSYDDTFRSFTDGTLIATLALTRGSGYLKYFTNNPQYSTGWVRMEWDFTSVPISGFWLNDKNNEMNNYLLNYGWVVTVPVVGPGIGNVRVNNPSMHGSYWMDIDSKLKGGSQVLIPEPTSLILLGTGLIGLAALGRKKKRI